jgi:hypothetical protein
MHAQIALRFASPSSAVHVISSYQSPERLQLSAPTTHVSIVASSQSDVMSNLPSLSPVQAPAPLRLHRHLARRPADLFERASLGEPSRCQRRSHLSEGLDTSLFLSRPTRGYLAPTGARLPGQDARLRPTVGPPPQRSAESATIDDVGLRRRADQPTSISDTPNTTAPPMPALPVVSPSVHRSVGAERVCAPGRRRRRALATKGGLWRWVSVIARAREKVPQRAAFSSELIPPRILGSSAYRNVISPLSP